MATKKKTPSKRGQAKTVINVRAAMAAGKSAAQEAVAIREKKARKRSALESEIPPRRRAPGAPKHLPPRMRALFGTRKSIATLLAEGDSWFDYPGKDILAALDDQYLYDVKSVAHMGDCVEDMAHSGSQYDEFVARLVKLISEGHVPKAILLSGGGNDIAGDEFAILLNHAASSRPGLNEDIVRGVIDVRLQEAYVTILSGLTETSKRILGKTIPIVIHGYDHPIPDGRGYLGGRWLLPGPWLKPGFRRKGYDDLTANTALVAKLIDRFNNMLKAVSSLPAFSHVHYLDLRDTLAGPGSYKTYWANELHPTSTGFDLVTKKFADLISKL